MGIEKLDHVNLRTTRLQEMVTWYTDVLGLISGKRPDFGFPGAWLYAGDQAVVHLVAIEGPEGIGSEVALKMEHVAFTARDAKAFEARLKTGGVAFKKGGPPGTKIVAYNLWDPDGNHIHVDFEEG